MQYLSFFLYSKCCQHCASDKRNGEEAIVCQTEPFKGRLNASHMDDEKPVIFFDNYFVSAPHTYFCDCVLQMLIVFPILP